MDGGTMSTTHEENVRHAMEDIWSAGNLELIDGLFLADSAHHSTLAPEPVHGADELETVVSRSQTPFLGLECTVEEGDQRMIGIGMNEYGVVTDASVTFTLQRPSHKQILREPPSLAMRPTSERFGPTGGFRTRLQSERRFARPVGGRGGVRKRTHFVERCRNQFRATE